jgi:hypothetical protein
LKKKKKKKEKKKKATIQFFLNLIKGQSPGMSLSIFMTDRNQAQVNAIWAVFPKHSRLFYCWWHVLRAIRTYFNTKDFPNLWSHIKDRVCVTDEDKFNACWKYIQGDTSVPSSMAQYIAQDWLLYKEMWSTMSR